MKKTGVFVGALAVAGTLLAAGLMMEPVRAERVAMPSLCVLNVKKVFEASPKFKAAADELKLEMGKKEEELRSIQGAAQAKQQMVKTMKNAGDRESMEKEINDLQFQFAKKQRQYREEMGKAEAEMVGGIYKEMSALLATYCNDNHILIVMRLDEPTSEMPEDAKVMTQVSRQVIYYHQHIDLTAVVSDAMKTMGATGGAGAAGAK